MSAIRSLKLGPCLCGSRAASLRPAETFMMILAIKIVSEDENAAGTQSQALRVQIGDEQSQRHV